MRTARSSLTLMQPHVSTAFVALLLCSAFTAHAGDPKETFERIYAQQVWGPDGGGSGLGSSLSYTAVTRKVLFDFVVSHNISSIVDAPCGSFVWMTVLLKRLAAHDMPVEYFGFDVVSSVIEGNIVRHQNETNLHFALHISRETNSRAGRTLFSRATRCSTCHSPKSEVL